MTRRDVTIRIRRLDDDGLDDGLAGETTAAQRLALVWTLTQECWALGGDPVPTYAISDAPVELRIVGAVVSA